MKISAMIFAAGLGSRLYPLTEHKPKALVTVDGVTLLENAIQKIIASGIDHIVVNVYHFADQIIDFLNTHPFNATIRISDERDLLLDTAGGLKHAGDFFTDSDHILLYNVDIYSTISLEKIIDQHITENNIATLAIRDRKTFRYFLFDTQSMRLAGWENRKSGEKKISIPLDQYKSLAFSGIHVIKKGIIDLIPEGKVSFTPLYLDLAKEYMICGYDHSDDEWMDFGKYDELHAIYGNRIQ